MKFVGIFLFAGLISAIAATPFGPPPERSLSTSRQFFVYGTNPQLRGAVAEMAEQVKENALAILHQNDHWKTPIVINLQFPQANIPDVPNAALYFSQTGAGLKLQLDLVIDSDVRAQRVQREILRAILLERIYRSEPDLAAGTFYVQPPDWLLDGLLAAAPGEDRAPLKGAVSSLLTMDKPVSLEDFLRQRPGLLDSPARQLYRAYSLALVQTLLDPANGGPRLANYIDDLRKSPNDQFATLQSKFPGITAIDLNNLWQAQLRRLDTTLRFEMLAFAETERRLEEILRIKIPGGKADKTAGIEDLLGIKLSSSQKAALILTGENLALLAANANPLMRPVVTEYQRIAQLAVAGKRKGLSARLAGIKSTRTKLIARMNDVDDYMNWFEATQLKTRSDIFENYMRSASDRDSRSSRRRDAISVYLDALEQQTGN